MTAKVQILKTTTTKKRMKLKKPGPHTQPQATNTHNLPQHEQHNQKTTTTIDSLNPNSHNNLHHRTTRHTNYYQRPNDHTLPTILHLQITMNDAHLYNLLTLPPTNIPSRHQKRESLRVVDPVIILILQDWRVNGTTTTRPREKDNFRLEKDKQALNLLLSRHRREGNSKIQLLESRTGRHRKE